jgi:hypothetical protein
MNPFSDCDTNNLLTNKIKQQQFKQQERDSVVEIQSSSSYRSRSLSSSPSRSLPYWTFPNCTFTTDRTGGLTRDKATQKCVSEAQEVKIKYRRTGLIDYFYNMIEIASTASGRGKLRNTFIYLRLWNSSTATITGPCSKFYAWEEWSYVIYLIEKHQKNLPTR